VVAVGHRGVAAAGAVLRRAFHGRAGGGPPAADLENVVGDSRRAR
jgi:hypothetical protein